MGRSRTFELVAAGLSGTLPLNALAGFHRPRSRQRRQARFFRGSNFKQDFRLLDLKANSSAPFLPGRGPDMGAFSFDRKRIAYVNDKGLWTSRSDGQEAALIATGLFFGFPRWSPDGRTLAFTGRAALPAPVDRGEERVYFVSANGGTPRPLLTSAQHASDPDWSPDGSQLVIVRDTDSSGEHTMLSLTYLTGKFVDVEGSFCGAEFHFTLVAPSSLR